MRMKNKKFQGVLKEIRQENNEEIKNIQEECEDKINQINSQHEEEISFFQRQSQQVRDQWQQSVGNKIFPNFY